jgi:histidinol-phosphate aminotransferase
MEKLALNENLLATPVHVAGKPIEEVRREFGLETIIKLASNENPLGPSPLAVEAIREAMTDAHRYPGLVETELRGKLAGLVDPDFDENNIIIGNGSCDVLRMVCLGFLHDGGESIVCPTTFPMYRIYTQMFGGKLVFVEARNYAYDLPAMAERIGDRTRLISIANPNNPTGTLLTQQQVDDFMEQVPEHVVVVFDEAYYDYVEAAEYADVRKYIKQGRNVIITRTFSKIYGLAGLRIGYGVAKKEMVEYLQHARSPFHVGSVNLIGAMASLDDVEHIQRSKGLNAAGKRYLYEQFDKLDLPHITTECNFILLPEFKHGEEAMSEALLRRGVIVRPAGPFGAPGAIRVTIGTREENERLVWALEEALHELEKGQLASKSTNWAG